jgi:cell division protein FtsW
MENYRRQRFVAFLNVEGNKGHWGYQVYQSMISIANGGMTGVGVGDGAGKWGYVPLAHTDFIFAIIAEELGFVGAISVIGLFFLFIVFGIQAALGARDAFGALLAGGVTAWFGVQAIVNIGGVTGAMPVTGLTLPFISYGGSSLLVTMAATGLLLNVARHMK